MTSTSKGNKTTWRKSGAVQEKGSVGCAAIIAGCCSKKLSSDMEREGGGALSGFSEEEMWTYGREVENKIAPWLLRWEWYLFSWELARRHALYPAFVLQSRESPCFNACRLTMHCYYTVFMFTSCVIWPKESLQSERAHAKFMLIWLFQSVEKSILQAWCAEMTEYSLTDTKSTRRLRVAFAVQGIECIRALVIVCSPYISLSLGLFFDNNYDCGV